MTNSQDNAKGKIHIKARIKCKCYCRYTQILKKLNVPVLSNYSINQYLISTIQKGKTWGKHTHKKTVTITGL